MSVLRSANPKLLDFFCCCIWTLSIIVLSASLGDCILFSFHFGCMCLTHPVVPCVFGAFTSLLAKTQEGGYARAAALVQILSTFRQIPVIRFADNVWINKSCNSSIALRSLSYKEVVVRGRISTWSHPKVVIPTQCTTLASLLSVAK